MHMENMSFSAFLDGIAEEFCPEVGACPGEPLPYLAAAGLRADGTVFSDRVLPEEKSGLRYRFDAGAAAGFVTGCLFLLLCERGMLTVSEASEDSARMWELLRKNADSDPGPLAGELLFSPLGMNNTSFGIPREDGLYVPCAVDEDTGTLRDPRRCPPDGMDGLYSVPEDLLLLLGDLLAARMRKPSRVFSPWCADLVFREFPGRMPFLRRRGNGTDAAFFSDFHSPDACGLYTPGLCTLTMDPEYGTAFVILSGLYGTKEPSSALRRLENRMFAECAENKV